MKKTNYIIIAGILLITIAIFYFNSGPGKYDDFAKCLTEKGVKFYGAFWCSHCQEQKKLFGSSIKYITYIECSTPSGLGQTQICIQENIESYPKWIFPDNTSLIGPQTLEKISSTSNCQLN